MSMRHSSTPSLNHRFISASYPALTSGQVCVWVYVFQWIVCVCVVYLPCYVHTGWCLHCSLRTMINLHSLYTHWYCPSLAAKTCLCNVISHNQKQPFCPDFTQMLLALHLQGPRRRSHSKMADQQLTVWFNSPWREEQNVEEYSSLYKYIMIQWASFSSVFYCIMETGWNKKYTIFVVVFSIDADINMQRSCTVL